MYLQKDEEWRHSIWCGICGKDLSFENGKRETKKLHVYLLVLKEQTKTRTSIQNIDVVTHLSTSVWNNNQKNMFFVSLFIHSTFIQQLYPLDAKQNIKFTFFFMT